ncbi:MAG: ATP-binding protein [Xanthomonadales bacterium]|nr:ATP-binding protein [Xanthomonadales bacterium]
MKNYHMPRLFWKLFFSLWLSIMAFAVVVAWINQTVILLNVVEEPERAYDVNLKRFEAKLVKDLHQGGERQMRKSLQALPRGLRNHVFVIDDNGKELLGRERVLKKHRQVKARLATRKLQDANGRVYTLISAARPPPKSLLAPGPWGVGMRLAVAAVISALVSLLLARYLAAPLGLLSRASRTLAKGDLSTRVGPPLARRKDEFGQLALDMDEMARRLQVSQQANQRLLRDVSHELRSPLARLRVALEIARNKDQSQVGAELDRIELESERLENLVDEVLGLLRESTGPAELNVTHFDLAELLQDLVETVNYEIGERGEAIELQAPAPVTLHADRELLWRVFENLLRNAMIHSQDAGGIEICLEQASSDEIQVSVRDSGPGIAEAHIDRIFEPFYRVDEARSRGSGGHGLGLAIAASAVRRHGGRILASNREQGGLEVRVVLPLG